MNKLPITSEKLCRNIIKQIQNNFTSKVDLLDLNFYMMPKQIEKSKET